MSARTAIAKFWPARDFTIHTGLSPEEIFAILEANIEPRKWFRTNRNHKYFEGTYTSDAFHINRIIHYRNSFLPRIAGRIAGNAIHITMRVHPAVLAFMAVWFGGVLFCGITITATMLAQKNGIQPAMLMPLGMLVFGIVMLTGGFTFEASKQQKKLFTLLDK